VTVHKHIGSYATDGEKIQLLAQAQEFIAKETQQKTLFDHIAGLSPATCVITESRPCLVYDILANVYHKLGFSTYPDELIKDLVIARIYAPVSKRETRDILSDAFGREYSLLTVYRHLKKAIKQGLKDTFQKELIRFAHEQLHDTLNLVFYDVTTLYFESTAQEGMKDFGFSKDHRPGEVQIVLGLVVNGQGFPLYFDVFSGKTFEGHTFLTVIEGVQKLLNNPDLVVIADAAMISQDNIAKLLEKKISFIVGARIANLSPTLIDTISAELKGQDGKTHTVTYHGQRLICHYSSKRAAKDRSNREKRIKTAKKIIDTPTTMTGHYRFLKTKGQELSLHKELITKAEKLEGIKGYVTNTNLSETTIIERYHDLWHIENSFRITKSDLEARPIFLRLDETIKAHVVIVFAGLAICRYIEIQSGMTIKKALTIAGKVLTHKVTNPTTGEVAYINTTIEDKDLCGKLDVLRGLGH
jgi:transposase